MSSTSSSTTSFTTESPDIMVAKGFVLPSDHLDWPQWKLEFLAYANGKGYGDSLTNSMATLPDLPGNVAIFDEQPKVLKIVAQGRQLTNERLTKMLESVHTNR